QGARRHLIRGAGQSAAATFNAAPASLLSPNQSLSTCSVCSPSMGVAINLSFEGGLPGELPESSSRWPHTHWARLFHESVDGIKALGDEPPLLTLVHSQPFRPLPERCTHRS